MNKRFSNVLLLVVSFVLFACVIICIKQPVNAYQNSAVFTTVMTNSYYFPEDSSVELKDVRNANFTKNLIKGQRGTIIMFGDFSGSCNNSTGMLNSLTEILKTSVSSKGIEFYVFQIKDCDDNTIVSNLNANKVPETILVHNEGNKISNSSSSLNSLYNSCVLAGREMGVISGSSYTLPLIVFVDSNGKIVQLSYGSIDDLTLVSHMKDAGYDVNIGYSYKANISGTISYKKAYDFLDRINDMRSKQGLSVLKMDEKLLDAAMLRAAESSLSFNSGHIRPNGRGAASVSEYYRGENALYGCKTADESLNTWKNSPAHYSNMTNPNYQTIGVGVYIDQNTQYWVTDFGTELYKEVDRTSLGTVEKNKTYTIDAVSSYANPYVEEDVFAMNVNEKKTVNVIVSPTSGIKTVIALDVLSQTSDSTICNVIGNNLICTGKGLATIAFYYGNNHLGSVGVWGQKPNDSNQDNNASGSNDNNNPKDNNDNNDQDNSNQNNDSGNTDQNDNKNSPKPVVSKISREDIDYYCTLYGYNSGTDSNPVYWTYDYKAISNDATTLDNAAQTGYYASHVPYGEKYRSSIPKNAKSIHKGEYYFKKTTSRQCWGMADFLGWKLTGKCPSNAKKKNTANDWIKYTTLAEVNNSGGLQVGDVIHVTYPTDDGTGNHLAMIISVEGEKFTTVECWGSNKSKNKISYNGKLRANGKAVNTLQGLFNNFTTVSIARFNGTPLATPTPTATPTPKTLESFSLNKPSANIVCGKSLTLKTTVKTNPAGLAYWVSWKSSDPKIATVDTSGKVTTKKAGIVTITATVLGVSRNCTITVQFKDVTDSSDFWYKPTYYLTSSGVVKGYDNQTYFKPANDCTRAQMLTFMWRLQGCPEPKIKNSKFPDVKVGDYFYKPVLWATEKGITTGYDNGKFIPQNYCTRAQTVTFLWRMAGKPCPSSTTNPFSDVNKDQYFYTPVLWASEMNIVKGYDDKTFRPQGKCLRRQMVTFLYKYDKYVNGKG